MLDQSMVFQELVAGFGVGESVDQLQEANRCAVVHCYVVLTVNRKMQVLYSDLVEE